MKNSHVNQNNFDLIRFLLASIVFLYHVSVLTQLQEFSGFWRLLSADLAVDSFFVVSGFLIFMSYEKTSSIKRYFQKRLKRIFPGYLTVIIICSIILLPISSWTAEDYFSYGGIKYILVNSLTLNFLQHTLPGVFEKNYMTAVNGALWTIKIEVLFYLLVPLIVILFSRVNKLVAMIAIYCSAVIYSLAMLNLGTYSGSELYLVLERQLPGQLAFFISGAFLYYYFEVFKKHSTIIFFIGLLIFVFSRINDFYFFYPASLAILVIYVAMFFKYLGNWGKFGDFSFGIYIWHFPIIQVFIHFNFFEPNLYFGLSGLIMTVFIIAYLSWHLVEKPFLGHHSHYRKVEVSKIS